MMTTNLRRVLLRADATPPPLLGVTVILTLQVADSSGLLFKSIVTLIVTLYDCNLQMLFCNCRKVTLKLFVAFSYCSLPEPEPTLRSKHSRLFCELYS